MLTEETTNYLNKSTMNSSNSILHSNCSLEPTYYDFERIYYLVFMCPIALVGIISNVITFRIFSEKCFNSITFKYFRFIAITDSFICIIVVPYCITSYTQAFNNYDSYFRNIYLAYVYLPMTNLLISLSMYFNALVSIDRLVSVGKLSEKNLLKDWFPVSYNHL